jgi:hypothetical protein
MIYPIATYLVACAIVALYGRKTSIGVFGVFCASIFLTPIPVVIGLLLFASDTTSKSNRKVTFPAKRQSSN